MTTSASQNARPSSGLLPSRKLVWTLRTLCAIALSLSTYLAWTALNAIPVYGCGGGEVFDCGHVLNSQYAKVFGIPVSVPAVALYLSLLGVLAFIRPTAPAALLRAGWCVLTCGALTAALSALWFIGIQVFAVEHLCAYCLGAHSCGLLLAGIVLWKRPLGNWQTSAWSGVSVTAVAVLITAQVTSEPPQQFLVERFDEMEAAPADIADAAADGPVDFAPPGAALAVTADDDGLFAPPVVDDSTVANNVFAPPVEFSEPDALPTEPPPATNDSESSTAEEPAGPAVTTDITTTEADPPKRPRSTVAAATYLFISPSTAALLHRLITVTEALASDESDGTPGALQADATAAKKAAAANTGQVSELPVTPPEPRLVSVSGNKFRLDTRHWPLLGSPDARYVFVEMFDYTCPHCRNTHRAIDGAFKKYGEDLAVIALPVPLDGSCNDTVRSTSSAHRNACELARMSVAVWRIDRDQFKIFHDWLFASSYRSSAAARQKAEQLVGKAALTTELAQPHAGAYIKRHVELYKKVGRGSVPKLMFPKATMTGEVSSTSTLCRTIERELAQQ